MEQNWLATDTSRRDNIKKLNKKMINWTQNVRWKEQLPGIVSFILLAKKLQTTLLHSCL